MLEYWSKLTGCESITPYLFNCYMVQRQELLQWATFIQSTVNQRGKLYLWDSAAVNLESVREVHQILRDQYIQKWLSTLTSTEGKLRTYRC